MVNLKLVEAYAVLLILCTALIIFGIFQMQLALSAVVSQVELSPFQAILHGILVSALGLVLCTSILVLFFRRMRKRQEGQAEGKVAQAKQ